MYQQVNLPIGARGTIKRLSDNAFIPFDSDNPDYQTYLKWLDGYELQSSGYVKTSNGNTPLPADE